MLASQVEDQRQLMLDPGAAAQAAPTEAPDRHDPLANLTQLVGLVAKLSPNLCAFLAIAARSRAPTLIYGTRSSWRVRRTMIIIIEPAGPTRRLEAALRAVSLNRVRLPGTAW